MGSIVENAWDQFANQYMASVAFTLLYYDYLLTFDRERRLFWSRDGLKQWGSLLFFFNRYCGTLGHIPVIIQAFVPPESPLYQQCYRLHSYHQALAVIMQTIAGFTFIARTYALYNRSRVVLTGLTSLALVMIVIGGWMMTQGEKLGVEPKLPMGSVGCSVGLSWSQAWRLAVVWCGPMVFDLVVAAMTLTRTIKINRGSGKDRTLAHLLIRDGVMYYSLISLATMSNIITFLRGSEITRGVATTITNILASVLVSRLMFNLREPRRHHDSRLAATTTAAASTAPASTTILLHTLTKIEETDGPTVSDSQIHQRSIV